MSATTDLTVKFRGTLLLSGSAAKVVGGWINGRMDSLFAGIFLGFGILFFQDSGFFKGIPFSRGIVFFFENRSRLRPKH